MVAEASPAHPHELVAVWLEALNWIADPRWRRLSMPGPHYAAALELSEALHMRVLSLKLMSPLELMPHGGAGVRFFSNVHVFTR